MLNNANAAAIGANVGFSGDPKPLQKLASAMDVKQSSGAVSHQVKRLVQTLRRHGKVKDASLNR
jgi:hypothetical protein